jgi:hypothetical protein
LTDESGLKASHLTYMSTSYGHVFLLSLTTGAVEEVCRHQHVATRHCACRPRSLGPLRKRTLQPCAVCWKATGAGAGPRALLPMVWVMFSYSSPRPTAFTDFLELELVNKGIVGADDRAYFLGTPGSRARQSTQSAHGAAAPATAEQRASPESPRLRRLEVSKLTPQSLLG